MSKPRVMLVLGILTVIAFGATATIVFAAKRRSNENQQAQAAAEAYRANATSQAQVGLSSPDVKNPFNQFADPVSGVQSSLNSSLYTEGRLSSNSIPDNQQSGQLDLNAFAGLPRAK